MKNTLAKQAELEKQAEELSAELLSTVSAETFMKVAAERGVTIESEEELEGAMKTASLLMILQQQSSEDLVKSAQADLFQLVENLETETK